MTTVEKTKLTLPRRVILAGAISLLGLAGAASAQDSGPALADLQVVDRETGQVAQVWWRGGRMYVAGRPGARYSLRVANRTGERVMVVMSVDGVNIVTGQTAGYGQNGYVLYPYQSYDVSGWRKSNTEVAAFTFAPLSQSYAARTGRPNDVGVIGMAVYRERPAPVVVEQSRDASDDTVSESVIVTGSLMRSAPADAARAAPPPPRPAPPSSQSQSRSAQAQAPRAEKLGTGHGARETSVVTLVNFERASQAPSFVRQIEYDSYDNLVAAGVIPRPRPAPPRPRPFPSSPTPNGYVPDPPRGR
ncbi:hypothetical protein BH11PSE2_BH11PSE2_19310 [soil metagenome]